MEVAARLDPAFTSLSSTGPIDADILEAVAEWDPDSEIERKFVVNSPRDIWPLDDGPPSDSGTDILQGYLYKTHGRSLRFRVAGGQLTLSVKWPRHALFRREKETLLPPEFADDLLRFCEPHIVRKTRYPIVHGDDLWTVDVFRGANAGLIVAEVELRDHKANVEIPNWCAREVTENPAYYNDYLAEFPYQSWNSSR